VLEALIAVSIQLGPVKRHSRMSERRFFGGDYAMLVLIAALTVAVIVGLAEGGARVLFSEREDSCVSVKGFVPNCTSVQKVAEGPLVTNHYNECGYRTAEPCGPKPAGAIRVAVVGTSISRGYAVAYEDSFAARASADLSRLCGRPVEFQNVGIAWGATDGPAWEQFDDRVEEAYRLQPNLVMFVLAPWDIWKYRGAQGEAPAAPAPRRFERWPFYSSLHQVAEYARRVREQSRAVLVLRHLVYLDRDTFVRRYLMNGDESDYLRTPLSDPWRRRLQFVDGLLDKLARESEQAKVPNVVVYVPFAPQVILAASNPVEPGIEPLAFDRAIGRISASRGSQYIDVLRPMSRRPRPADMYYSVNGHPNAQGHEVIAQAVVSGLLSNAAFSSCESANAVGTVGFH
jgi:hypothetical protein